jgi:hypothetical protein
LSRRYSDPPCRGEAATKHEIRNLKSEKTRAPREDGAESESAGQALVQWMSQLGWPMS